MNRQIKKILSGILTAVIFFACVPVVAFGGDTPLKITVAADTHFQCAADLGDFSDVYTEYMLEPELYGYASTQGQMPYESEAILCEMLAEFTASDAECLLIAGDLTCGKRASHLAFAEYLRETEETSGKKIFVINGNHDCDAEGSDTGISMEEFREIYADFGYTEAVARHKDSASYAAELNGKYRLLAIDTCIYGEDEGRISANVFQWIKAQVKQAKADGKTPVAMMHHSLLPHYELQPMIDFWQFYAGWFADHGIQTVLTGHIHANDISSCVSDCGNTVYDIQTGALIASPNTYREITFSDDTVTVESRFITKIDPSLLPSQLTDAQRALLAEDFPAYARAYFENGVCKWMNRNLGSVNRLARWFRLKEGTSAYAAAEKLMKTVGAAVGQEIYDDGSGCSIEAALLPFGITVPESDYRKPYQVAAKIMYGFFHGDEDAAGNEADVKLLLACLEGAVLTALKDGFSESSLRTLASALPGSELLTNKLATMPLSKLQREIAEKTALALLETLTGGFIDDYSTPEDLNVSLPSSVSGDATALHASIHAFRLVAEFFQRLFGIKGR
ncbi:MAG: metallophosphoesterase [Clostridia bacterium]|nr:metallophosphoesterase [Clostridia bacterium]